MLTWLFSIVRKTAADQRRRRLMHKLLLDPLAIVMANADPEPPAEVSIEQGQLRAGLTGALAALPRRQREVLLLVFYHDLTIEEAARAMDTSLGSARAALRTWQAAVANTIDRTRHIWIEWRLRCGSARADARAAR